MNKNLKDLILFTILFFYYFTKIQLIQSFTSRLRTSFEANFLNTYEGFIHYWQEPKTNK